MKGRIIPKLLRLVRTSPKHRLARGTENTGHPTAGVARAGTVLILVILLAVAANFGSAAKRLVSRGPAAGASSVPAESKRENVSFVRALARSAALLQSPSPPPEGGVITYDCSTGTLKSDFNLGDAVCAKASGAPFGSLFPWRVIWVDPAGFVEHSDIASSDPDTEYRFTLPSSQTSVVNGVTVNNRGTWRVNLTRPNGAVRFSTSLSAHEAAHAVADLSVQKFIRDGDSSVAAGSSIVFIIVVANAGPDAAQTVHLVDSLPTGATPLSFTQQSGPNCTPAGSSDCTIASLANGGRAEFTAIYTIGADAATGTVLTTARVTSQTTELNDSDNNATAQFEITAGGGGSQCTLLCPTSISVNNDPGTGAAVIHQQDFPVPVTSGTCGSVSTTASPNPTTHDYTFPIGTTVITASTETGETCTFTVTVNDTENPTISCPQSITAFEDTPGSGSATVNYTVGSSDNSGSATVNCDHPSGSSFSLGATTVTCTATDDAGNSSPSCSFDVTVKTVNNACTLTPPASIVTDSEANSCGAHVTFTVTAGDSCDAHTTISCNHASGSLFPVGNTLVTCTSSPDGATTSFTVTVNDTTPPVPTVDPLPTITKDCHVSLASPPTATDNCNGLIGANTNDPRDYDAPGTYTVHWTYTDAAGNTTTQNQTVIVTPDSTPPVPDLATLPTITGECTATAGIHTMVGSQEVVEPPTATDNCSGANVVGTTTDPLTYTGAGTYTVHWTYTDAAGNSSHQNQTVVVTDSVPPVINAPPDAGYTCPSEVPAASPSQATATDNCGIAPTVTVSETRSGAGSASSPLVIRRTFTATDTGGNHASATQTITVIDNTPPTLNVPADITVGNDAGSCSAVVNFAVSATDNCGTANVTTDIPSGTTFPKGTTTVTATATDAAGNQTTRQFHVTVNDTQPPTIAYPASGVVAYLPLNSTATSMQVNFTVTAADNCPGVSLSVTPLPPGSVFPVGTTHETATATDAAGNHTTANFDVTVLYDFTGFFSPVVNQPTLNLVNAGRAVPVKFSLSGNKGLSIFAAGSPASQQINCSSDAPISTLDATTTAGSSSLSYDAASDQYNYVWKTDSSWAGQCRALVVTLNDGSTHTALFKFR